MAKKRKKKHKTDDSSRICHDCGCVCPPSYYDDVVKCPCGYLNSKEDSHTIGEQKEVEEDGRGDLPWTKY